MRAIALLIYVTVSISCLHAATFDWGAGTVEYEVLGTGNAIVLLHGGFGDSRMWDEQFAAFAKEYRVLRYDQPGFGKSTKPEGPYSPVSILMKLMDHLGLQKASLIGNSMGGSLAIDFTLLHPERVDRVVIVASGPNGYPVPQEDQQRMNLVFSTAAQKGLDPAIELWLGNPMVAVAMNGKSTRTLLEAMVRDNSNIFLMRFWPVEKMDPSAVKRLNEIKNPSLIIVGDQDTAFIRDWADAAATGIQGAKKIVIKETDHLPQMEKPFEFNKAVLDFLH